MLGLGKLGTATCNSEVAVPLGRRKAMQQYSKPSKANSQLCKSAGSHLHVVFCFTFCETLAAPHRSSQPRAGQQQRHVEKM